MRIDQKIIDDIRNSASISEVIGHYIPIIKRGRNYVAVCPFHDDHDPSLSISEDKKIYKCFVCGKGGNVFNFVMDYTKCSFPEAVAEVAKIIGKPLNIDLSTKAKKVSPYQKYYDLMQDSIGFLSYALNTYAGEKALEYLNQRGLDKECIDYFEIGFNPDGDVLSKYLKSKEYTSEDMEKCNVARLSDYGMKDFFSKRITFPIHDRDGNAIAFSARAFDDESTAKYINTSETLIYKKGEVVYNYHRAHEEAKRANRVIVVEGVMDVIALHRAGILNAVSTLGTACTKEQLNLIASLSANFIFFYDGDKAGRAATAKAIELAYKMGYNPRVIINNTGQDPDEIINNSKAKGLRDITSKEVTGIEFAFSYYKDIYPLINYDNKKLYMRKLSSLIELVKDEYDRVNFYHELKTITGLEIPRARVKVNRENNLKKVYNNGYGVVDENPYIPPIESFDGLTKAEYTIIKMISNSKRAVEIYRKDLGYLIDPTREKVIDLIINQYRKDDRADVAKLVDEIVESDVRNELLTIETVSSKYVFDDTYETYDEDFFRAMIERVKRATDEEHLKYLMQEASKNAHDEDKVTENLKQVEKLVRKLANARKEKLN